MLSLADTVAAVGTVAAAIETMLPLPNPAAAVGFVVAAMDLVLLLPLTLLQQRVIPCSKLRPDFLPQRRNLAAQTYNLAATTSQKPQIMSSNSREYVI